MAKLSAFLAKRLPSAALRSGIPIEITEIPHILNVALSSFPANISLQPRFLFRLRTINMSEIAKVPLGSLTNRVSSRQSAALKPASSFSRPSPSLCSSCEGQEEYIRSLQVGLLEVSEENEVLRERVVELEAVLTQVEEESKERDADIVKALERRMLACSTKE